MNDKNINQTTNASSITSFLSLFSRGRAGRVAQSPHLQRQVHRPVRRLVRGDLRGRARDALGAQRGLQLSDAGRGGGQGELARFGSGRRLDGGDGVGRRAGRRAGQAGLGLFFV
jgi:hypothetical protein